ncbi:MAG TPA: hypothetical protein VEB64_16590, partial [Azospirillaceae bacterium]|nr:hypothetical protein [Azospirillaceae bacterium]
MENTAFGVALLVYLALALAALAMINRQYKETGRLSREGAGILIATFAVDAVLRIVSAWGLQPDGISHLIHPWALGVLLAGAALASVAAKEFGSAPKVLCLEAGDLTRTGLYRYSRNPQIIGYLIAVLGFSVAW